MGVRGTVPMGAAGSLTPGGTQTSLKGDFRAICLGSERLFARIRQAVAVQAAPATLRAAFLEPIGQRLAGDLSLELFARRDEDVMGMFAGQLSSYPHRCSPSVLSLLHALYRLWAKTQLATFEPENKVLHGHECASAVPFIHVHLLRSPFIHRVGPLIKSCYPALWIPGSHPIFVRCKRDVPGDNAGQPLILFIRSELVLPVGISGRHLPE